MNATFHKRLPATKKNRYIYDCVTPKMDQGRRKRDVADLIFDPTEFKRTLSYREFATSISLAVLLIAMWRILDYYQNVEWLESYPVLPRFFLFALILPLNHVIYKAEHRRPNNYMGRNLHDIIFLFSLMVINWVYMRMLGTTITYTIDDAGDAFLLLLALGMLVMCMEVIVALAKRLFAIVKWQPL